MPNDSDTKKYILLVDDQPATIRVLKERLTEECNALVHVARSLNQAYEMIRNNSPNFVLLDLYIPLDLDKLGDYKNKIELGTFNQGELLGAYLDEKRIPYLYFTSHGAFYRGGKHDLVLLKTQPIEEIIKRIEERLIEDPT